MAEKGKVAVKKWVFRDKKRVFGAKNNALATILERLNGAKRRLGS